MLFALLVEFGSTPPTEELMRAHKDWLAARFSEGSFILSGAMDAVDPHPPSAIALFEAGSPEAATVLVNTEPLFSAGVCTHRVVPFTARVRAADIADRLGPGVRVAP